MDERDEWLEGVKRWFFGGTPPSDAGDDYDWMDGLDHQPARMPLVERGLPGDRLCVQSSRPNS